MKRPTQRATEIALVVALAGVTALTGCAPATAPACQVTDKDRATSSEGKSVYRVYTSCGVFNVEDAPFAGKFNAADTYAALQVGKFYDLETYGFRNGLLSMFPNIVKATEVQP